MSIDSHVAILTHASLAQATQNKKNGRTEYYALIAFPPAAANDLQSVLLAATNGAPLSNFSFSVKTNAQQEKPIPGIPGDWFIIRAATQYAPYLADEQGTHLDQSNPTNHLAIRQTFYAGAKVRAAISAYGWTYDRKPGLSFNLNGLMIAGETSERLAIGNTAENVFAKYAKQGASQAAPAAQGNPFAAQPQVQTQSVGGAQGGNPFAQAAPASSNPFASA